MKGGDATPPPPPPPLDPPMGFSSGEKLIFHLLYLPPRLLQQAGVNSCGGVSRDNYYFGRKHGKSLELVNEYQFFAANLPKVIMPCLVTHF